ncbi:LytR/AlgR family response regulator transcription factor [Mariniflexile sp. HMF6888]|uniref:LytR/AlgR family response regulator transcription factor n=1 Tax=Mariniflexile sp. HMF6888 TaxID=3373086 RepID=UPI0037A0AA27
MRKIKVLVVEDEIIIADNLCDSLNDLGFKALEPALSYTEAIELIELEKPNIAILDINLSGTKTGIDLAEKINADYNFPFIFLTSNSDKTTLDAAKKVMPPAYLVKPFSKEELYTTIEIVLNNFLNITAQIEKEDSITKEAIFIKDKGVITKVLFNDIIYLKSDHVYVEVILKNKKVFLIRGSLNDTIKELNNNFIQVHRSYVINLDYLQQIDHKLLIIHDNQIPIGKKYHESILKKINRI